MTNVLLGIDLGTSSVKVLAVDMGGDVVGSAAAAYRTHAPRAGWSEQDPDDWWAAAGEATRAAIASGRTGGPMDVVAVGLSGQMHTFVLLGADGRALRPAITWMDTRAMTLLGSVRATIAAAGLAPVLANPVVLGPTLLPLVWLRDHEPSVLQEAAALLSAKDHLRFRLVGEVASEPTDASATLLFDVAGRRWSPELMTAFGLPDRLLPPLGESDAVAGTLTGAAAEHLGLAAGIPVAFGAGDQQAAAVGMGSVRPGQAQLTIGTGAQVLAVRDAVTADPRLHAFCHVRAWVAQASVNNAGSALAWVRELLGVAWDDVYARLGTTDDALIFVPYLSGERTPLMKGHARGAWLGLDGAHGRADLARAAGEGVVTVIADAIDTLVDAATSPGPLRAAGGGMRHAAFAQAIADASGHAIEVRDVHDASGLGAALLGGIAVGVLSGLEDAAARAPARVAATYVPDVRRQGAWAARRRTLRELDSIGFHEVVRPGA